MKTIISGTLTCLLALALGTNAFAFEVSFTEADVMQLLEAHPAHKGLMNALGSDYLEKRQYDRAELQFKKILEMDPNYSPVYINYGLLALLQKNYKEAIVKISTGLLLNDLFGGLTSNNIAAAHRYLGLAFTRLNQFDAAIQEQKKAIQLNPASLESIIRVELGNSYLYKALSERDIYYIEKAKKQYDHVLAKTGNDPAALDGYKSAQKTFEVLTRQEQYAVS